MGLIQQNGCITAYILRSIIHFSIATNKRTDQFRLHPPRIRTAIRTHHMIRRNRERQQRSTLLAGDGLAVHVYREPARFTYHLLGTGERFHIRAATAAMALLRFMRLDFVIFRIQAVELQDSFSVRGGKVREPCLAEGRIFHAQGNFG